MTPYWMIEAACSRWPTGHAPFAKDADVDDRMMNAGQTGLKIYACDVHITGCRHGRWHSGACDLCRSSAAPRPSCHGGVGPAASRSAVAQNYSQLIWAGTTAMAEVLSRSEKAAHTHER